MSKLTGPLMGLSYIDQPIGIELFDLIWTQLWNIAVLVLVGLCVEPAAQIGRNRDGHLFGIAQVEVVHDPHKLFFGNGGVEAGIVGFFFANGAVVMPR